MPWSFVIAAAATVVASYVATALASWIAPRLGFVDRPDGQRKRHSAATPLLGGVGIFCGLFVGIACCWWLLPRSLPGDQHLAPILLACSAFFCLIGLWDDKWGMRPRTKFLWQILGCLPFVIWQRSLSGFDFMGAHIELGILGPVFTVFWLVACANIINLVDGLDGLAGMIGLIGALTIGALMIVHERFVVVGISAVLAASILGFLVHNWPPARIFMGDCGSLTIGFLIGALSLESSLKQAASFTFVVPALLVGVPVLDTAMAMLRRKLNGRGIGDADRRHIHHRLQDRGLNPTQALLVIGVLSGLMAVAAVAAAITGNDWIGVAAGATVFGGMIATRVFGYYEAVLLIGHIRAVGRLVWQACRHLPSSALLARLKYAEDHEPGRNWQDLCERILSLGGRQLNLRCKNAAGDIAFSQQWKAETAITSHQPRWAVSYELPVSAEHTVFMDAHGIADERLVGGRLDDLIRLFHVYSEYWGEQELPKIVGPQTVDDRTHTPAKDPIRIFEPTNNDMDALPTNEQQYAA